MQPDPTGRCNRGAAVVTKIYTCGGDEGNTSLGSGARVPKTHPRVCATGEVDELSAVLGLAAAASDEVGLIETLQAVQQDLMALGASLSAPSTDEDRPHITVDRVEWMEALIDDIDGSLPPLTRFILPGGSEVGATLHLARCVTRRAERSVVQLASAEGTNRESLRYLNRLSDLLFVMARQSNDGVEVEWRPE